MDENCGRKIVPVLVYGSHLWEIDRKTTMRVVNMAYRRGIRWGLGMNSRESIRDRFPDWFV